MKLLKAGFSGGGLGHGNGSNEGPDKIVEALKDVYSNEEGKEVKYEVEEVTVEESNIQESHDNIEKAVSELKECSVIVGGDHSITAPCVKGFAKNVSDFHFIVFDAHPDLMDDFDPPSQEDYLRVLIEKGVVKSENVTIIGVRNWDKEEIAYLSEKNIKYYTCADIFERGIKEVISEVVENVVKEVYLSVDIDVVDPVEAIGTGYTEHGGLSSRELIYSLQQLRKTEKISMIDLVEVNPSKDVNNMTVTLAAKLIAELYR